MTPQATIEAVAFRSFCSGIGAPETAWAPLGWRCLSTSEVDPQASAVLAARHPGVPNLGDMTTAHERMGDERADVFVAGTPCQSFSVAGLRAGMADPRGNLALVYLGLVDRARPEWVVWENVPGVLSSNGGRDFGALLGGLGQLGYGWCYRVLDAQYVRVESHPYAVPQRRRRVFVVGSLGGWQRAAAVLLERESLCGHPPPGREEGEGVAGCFTQGAHPGSYNVQDAYSGHLIAQSLCENQRGELRLGDAADSLKTGGGKPGQGYSAVMVAHTLRAEGSDASEDGTGRGVPLAFYPTNRQPEFGNYEGVSPAVKPGSSTGGNPPGVATEWGVRRCTPLEAERLQGFPDNYTRVEWKGKPMADGPRYRMLGNSMAVNCMSWIGQRIALVQGAPHV